MATFIHSLSFLLFCLPHVQYNSTMDSAVCLGLDITSTIHLFYRGDILVPKPKYLTILAYGLFHKYFD